MGDNSPLNRDNDWENNPDNQIMITDTLMYTPNIIEIDDAIFDATVRDSLVAPFSSIEPIRADSSAQKPEPVVIKKQIIQHQTVVVRDTVFIFE